MPPDMKDWLSEKHLVWFVLDVVAGLDTTAWHAGRRLGGVGRRGYDPDMLLALLVYAYAVGERSSRQIERLCECDVAFRVVCAQDAPDHSTVARFRAEHEGLFAGLFGQVLRLCAQAGMGRLGVVALDGTKIGADASMGANRTGESLRAEAERIVAEAAAVDAAEDALFGDARGDELAEQWCGSDRRSRIAAALAQLRADDEQRQQVSEAEAKAEAKTVAEYERRVAAGEAVAGRPPRGVDPVAVLHARRERVQREFERASTTRRRKDMAKVIRRTELALATARGDAADQPAEPADEDPVHDGAPVEAPAEGTGALVPWQAPVSAGGLVPSSSRQAGRARTANTTDPDSRIMKTQQGWVQGYNA